MKKRDDLFTKAKSTKDPDRWAKARELRNLVNDQCKYAENDFIKDKLKINEGNPHKFWNELNALVKSGQIECNQLVESDDCSNTSEVASAFNKFFGGIGVDLSRKILTLSNEMVSLQSQYLKEDATKGPGELFMFRNTNTLELNELVKRRLVERVPQWTSSKTNCTVSGNGLMAKWHSG